MTHHGDVHDWGVAAVVAASMLAGLLGGCKDGEPLVSRMNEDSRLRLEALPAAADVVVSLRGTTPAALEDLPPLEDEGKELGRAGSSVLVVVPRSSLDRLADIEGLGEAVVWGTSDIVAHLDPLLRGQILGQLDDPALRDTPLPMIATFHDAADGLETELQSLGASTRSITGNVVTLDAPPEAAFRILTMPALENLAQPRAMQWMREK